MSGSRLIVVSNRLPFSLKRTAEGWQEERSTGGLAAALGPMVRERNGLWIGWTGDGAEPDAERDQILKRWRDEHSLVTVDLPPEVAHDFYDGYANQTLWPLFHQFSMNVVFNASGWDAYVDANRRFADAVLEHLQPGDLVWVHDYHLLLLPLMLRERAPQVRVGFFLHIPFPSSDVFRILPRREELLRGLLGADFVAFHTFGDVQHFRSSLLRVLGVDSSMERVEGAGGFPCLGALPIGIAPDHLAGLLETDPAAQAAREETRRRFQGRRLLLAVDRLDYTKGLPHRLRTFRRLLRRAPHLREKVVLVQVAVPSREKVPMYQRIRHDVSELVGEINGEFSTPGWTPIVYIRRGMPAAELAALYAAADLAWVTPLRDGMNLVAKEYVACQEGRAGVLVLSEFAGAAAEMGEAVLVNPYDEARTSEAVERALELPEDERRERMATLARRVRRNDVFAWGRRFLDGLQQAADDRARRGDSLLPLPLKDFVQAYRASDDRLLFLDYDGTLVGFARRPREAVPPPKLLELLRDLTADPRTTTTMVSGRPRRDLDEWFGSIPRLWMAAEHGALLRAPDDGWRTLRPSIPSDWKARVLPVLEHFVDRTPGTFVEEKEYALVWHHRMADPDFGEWLAKELVAALDEMLAETELRAVRGHKVVEVRLSWANKGEVLEHLGRVRPRATFIASFGDDRTDEDLFERLGPEAWSVKVGGGVSRARFRLRAPEDVRLTLARLVRD
jgi:trehalose 6-phosphate synthase/phosphatase